jgi:hypothetical protein
VSCGVENLEGAGYVERVEVWMEGEQHLDGLSWTIRLFSNCTHCDDVRIEEDLDGLSLEMELYDDV